MFTPAQFKVPAVAIETWASLQNGCLSESEIREKIARICAGGRTLYTPAQVRECQDYAVKVYKAYRKRVRDAGFAALGDTRPKLEPVNCNIAPEGVDAMRSG
jgi:hypothetical protein